MGTQSFDARLHNTIIPSGQNASRAIVGYQEYSDAAQINIQSPATLDALTFTIEVSNDYNANTNTGTWAALNNGDIDIALPAAGKARPYTDILGYRAFRLKASGNVAANREFLISKQWTA